MSQSLVQSILERTERAHQAFIRGDAGPYQALFAHRDDVTLAGPFGNEPARGWTDIEPRMARAAALFRGGESRIELVHAEATAELVCLVMIERGTVEFVGRAEGPEPWVLRVTQVYRPIDGEWRAVHRHADPLIRSRSLDEVLRLLAS